MDVGPDYRCVKFSGHEGACAFLRPGTRVAGLSIDPIAGELEQGLSDRKDRK
jgi:hypothetical protein